MLSLRATHTDRNNTAQYRQAIHSASVLQCNPRPEEGKLSDKCISLCPWGLLNFRCTGHSTLSPGGYRKT